MGQGNSLPERLSNAQKTATFTLTDAGLKHIPDKILEVRKLRNLDIKSAICPIYSSFVWLKIVLTTVPIALTRLVALETLNPIRTQNHSITQKKASSLLLDLKMLDLSSNCIHQLPGLNWATRKIVTLQLSNNLLRSLPDSMASMKVLEDLDVSCNKIQEIPETFSGMQAIKSMRLANNNLIRFPESFLESTGVVWIELENNIFDESKLRQCRGYDAYILRRKNRVDQFIRT
ncbi:hypothetical protein BDEG_20214 [Batrachochytrium dendrobatidis JEL423]|uniref:Uncharacterized protein n=1 Tax=Batrachochytrium dendrobatidis (strain JEL423) TaxID=403673 RepID=A0A177W8K7_BATDL|nr:hypothetical protein BDEG_20214 [Batrachochytrium dendrobatidis JEL423]